MPTRRATVMRNGRARDLPSAPIRAEPEIIWCETEGQLIDLDANGVPDAKSFDDRSKS